jgi:hypothetical protein
MFTPSLSTLSFNVLLKERLLTKDVLTVFGIYNIDKVCDNIIDNFYSLMEDDILDINIGGVIKSSPFPMGRDYKTIYEKYYIKPLIESLWIQKCKFVESRLYFKLINKNKLYNLTEDYTNYHVIYTSLTNCIYNFIFTSKYMHNNF